METIVCSLCIRPKAGLVCECCQAKVCKKCVELLKAGSFSFLSETPENCSYRTYCIPCYSDKVAPKLAEYIQTMESAKQVYVYVKGQGEETRLYKRGEKPLQVINCEDRAETLMRLAFKAVEAGFNTLIDVEVISRKLRNEGYQTTKWAGLGYPSLVDEARLNTQKPRFQRGR